MKKQNMRMEIKQVSEDGSFTGVLSLYGNVDLGKDLVEAGAFTKTIKERGDEIPLLWQHKADMPIGRLKLIDGPDALRVEGQLLMSVQKAQEAYLLMKAGIVKGLSIGFDTLRETMDAGVRKLKELRLWEGSIVTFPMNEACQILSIKGKGITKSSFEEELAENELEAAGYLMMDALRSALSSIVWSDSMTPEEATAAAELSIQQFSDAYLAYLPNYLSYVSAEYGGMEMFSRKLAETKAGRTISAANKTTLQTAHDHMKSASDLIYPLLERDADAEDQYSGTTSKTKAGIEAKSEPVVDHSAIEGQIDAVLAKVLAN
jgi:HK97 family phage prohead protease